MKPTKMRNRLIYKASHVVQSSQLGSTLSDDLRKRYGKRSVRVTKGDHVSIQRGEYKGVDGKVTVVLPDKQYVAIEGIKKEKTKGDKFDVHIHTSNLMVTSLNTDDKWRMKVLHRGQDESSVKKDEGTVPESDNVTDVPTKAAKPEVAKPAKPAKPARLQNQRLQSQQARRGRNGTTTCRGCKTRRGRNGTTTCRGCKTRRGRNGTTTCRGCKTKGCKASRARRGRNGTTCRGCKTKGCKASKARRGRNGTTCRGVRQGCRGTQGKGGC